MDRVEQQEYIEILKKSKEAFCECILNEISQYEEELDKLQMQTTLTSITTAMSSISSESGNIESPISTSAQSTSDKNNISALHSQSKHELISMIDELQKHSEASNIVIKELQQQLHTNTQPKQHLEVHDELQNDIQYLLHVNPSTYNNVKRYIKHMKQQSMARYSSIQTAAIAPRFSQQIIRNKNKPNNALYRDSRKLPHPPRRNTYNPVDNNDTDNDYDIDNSDTHNIDDIEMLHFVISCLNWQTQPKYKTLRVELLTNDIAPIDAQLYENTMKNANNLVNHQRNRYKLNIDEIAVLKLFCECKEFALNFSRAYNMGIASHHRASFYQCAKIFHCIFSYKSVPISKGRLKHLLPPNINNFGYIVKAIEIGWILNDIESKYLVFNCSEDILIPNDTNKYDDIQYNHDDEHLMMISKFVKSNSSWNNRRMLRTYAWSNIQQLLSSQYLFMQQSQLNNKSLFDILFYEENLYKLALSQTFLDRAEINGNVYSFLFNHITLNVDTARNEIIMDLSNANPKIFIHKPSYYTVNTSMSFSDDCVTLSPSDSVYASDQLKWIHFVNDDDDYNEYNDDDDDDDDGNSIPPQIYDVNLSTFSMPILYLDSILNVNGLLKVIANSYYNREIKNNKERDASFCVLIEYTLSIGYINNADAAADGDEYHECLITSCAQYLHLNFNYLLRIFYSQLIRIFGYSLHSLSQRVSFCTKHKSFIILSLIYNYNYANYASTLNDELSLFNNKSLFEYLFFDCHHYELCKLFPRNHDLLLKPPHHHNTLIECDVSSWNIILNPMPKLMHIDSKTKSTFVAQRIMVYLSMDVELETHSFVKWKQYDIDPHSICNRQIIIGNVLCESCINWNNILIARSESHHDQPMILLYYKIECTFATYTIASTVRNIHISTEIDLELSENCTHFINEYKDGIDLSSNPIENQLIICDNLIIHENATIYTSFFNLKCNKLIDIRNGAAICADYRGSKGENVTFGADNDEKYDDDDGNRSGAKCYSSPYLNRSELIFGSGGKGGYLGGSNSDDITMSMPYNDEMRGVLHYLGRNFGINSEYKNPFDRGFVDVFCGGIGTRSSALSSILNDNNDNDGSDCYFISGKSDIWFAISFKFCRISITHYALRHVDVNSNYLRNWRFEAKCGDSDDDEWEVLSEHHNDESINGAKQWGVFEIETEKSNKFYQYFRVQMNGENSANCDLKKGKRNRYSNVLNLAGVFENTRDSQYILCCSGIELFGAVQLTENERIKSHRLREICSQQKKEFIYSFDGDENGILYWISTCYGTQKWCNASQSLSVVVERGKQSEKGSVDDIVSRAVCNCYFLDYFVIDFVEIAIKPSKYTLNLANNGHCWCIRASNDKRDWTIIREHIDDDKSVSFSISNCDSFYRYFKIENMNLLRELHCVSGFEIYGEIEYNPRKLAAPQLKSGGNGGGIINLSAPNIELDNCKLSANGENGCNGGGGGAAGNILIDAIRLKCNANNVQIECKGGQSANNNNHAQNGRIRLFCNTIEGKPNCDPLPLIM